MATLETLVVPRTRDLGDGFTVRRSLPATQRQMVGPFVFWDQMGPVTLQAGRTNQIDYLQLAQGQGP